MAGSNSAIVRQCAHEIIELSKDGGGDRSKLARVLDAPIRLLLQHPDLHALGVERRGNHTPNSKYLYYDGLLTISLDQFLKGKRVAVHDHSVWEALAVYRGRVDHTIYERKDGSKDGYAHVQVVEERVLGSGDVTLLAPPVDIHGLIPTEEGSYFVTIIGGALKKERTYFNPAERTCYARTPKNVT
jgi:predicted metal-dependent enzyme (double-stranded beta helix superfamily)